MSSEVASVHPDSSDPNQLREDLFVPLATISARMELLRRVTMVTLGLTNLERTVLLEGIAAAQEAAQQLGKHLEAMVARDDLADTPARAVADRTSECWKMGEAAIETCPGGAVTVSSGAPPEGHEKMPPTITAH